MKVTDKVAAKDGQLVTICDFSPPRAADLQAIADAGSVDADYICIAYNPGRSVRVLSTLLGVAIQQQAGKGVIFNLATRDMNKLAMQSLLLGAQMLEVENVLVVQGDKFREKDLAKVKDVSDYLPTEMMASIASMNEGLDYKGAKLKTPTDFCIGAALDLSQGVRKEAALVHKKSQAGAHFFLAQPVFNTEEITAFREAYREVAGEDLSQPVFWGLQILEQGGVIFSSVAQWVRDDLEKGRAGTDIALEILHTLTDFGVNHIYLVPPILKGGARNYEAAQQVLEAYRT